MFIKKIKAKFNSGSTIVELLIAVMVVGLIVTAVANAVTFSIKNTAESRFRQVATILGQQVIENFRSQKQESGIVNFSNRFSDLNYCYSDISAPTSGICDNTQVIIMAGTEFKRDVAVLKGGDGSRANPYFINFTIAVSWMDGAEQRQVELIQQLKQDSGFTN
jgi:type II secretory pathway pseudopilin PulG